MVNRKIRRCFDWRGLNHSKGECMPDQWAHQAGDADALGGGSDSMTIPGLWAHS